MKNVEEIRNDLKKLGINYTLLLEMRDDEILKADEYNDYSDLMHYMNFMARKYDI